MEGASSLQGAVTLGSTLRINGVTYTFPYSDGTASGKVLKTDGAGNLVWATDTDTQLTQEQVEDYAGAAATGNTETLITVTYQDADGTVDYVVDNDLLPNTILGMAKNGEPVTSGMTLRLPDRIDIILSKIGNTKPDTSLF